MSSACLLIAHASLGSHASDGQAAACIRGCLHCRAVKQGHETRPATPAPGKGCLACRYDHPVGDIIDVHDYVEPRSPGARYNRAAVLGEYGGLGYKVHPCMRRCAQEGPQGPAAGHALGNAV